MVTPHVAYLALAMAQRGHTVTYVAEQKLSPDRVALGWQAPDLADVKLHFAATPHQAIELARGAPERTVHLTQGLRSNGNIKAAQAAIRSMGHRHYAMMETVDTRGPVGWLKSGLYSWHLHRWGPGLDGILAIGAGTRDWLARLSPASLRISPFAYFLADTPRNSPSVRSGPFRIIFVGSLVALKRVELLLETLGGLSTSTFEVEVIGDGPLRHELQSLAARVLPGRVSFRGVLPIVEVPKRIAEADCLVLPSVHDGWGAVISEALLVGTPVICSSGCGARGVVQASRQGGVFPSGDSAALRHLLEAAINRGRITPQDRRALQSWARCVGAMAGAVYLEALLEAHSGNGPDPYAPWEVEGRYE